MKTLLKLIFKIIWRVIIKLLIIAFIALSTYAFIWFISHSDPSAFLS
jgi:hypothetical protein